MRIDRLRSAWHLLVSLAFAPGFLAHECAHAVACRVWGVEVRAGPALNPFDGAASLEHDPVRSFWADLTIATAPMVGNSALAIAAFGAAMTVEGAAIVVSTGAIDALPVVFALLGACFGLTAVPSPADTDRLLETARGLSTGARPIGVPLAAVVRAVTARSAITGLAAFGWTIALYVAVTGTPPG